MNRNTTIVLVLVLGALLVYLFAVQLPQDRAEAQATPTAGPVEAFVWTTTADQVNGLKVVDRAGNRTLAVARDTGGNWSITEPEPQPADGPAVTDVVGQAAGLRVDETITNVTDLDAFGVLSPTYELELSLVDGTRLAAVVGDKAPTGTGYYLQRAGEPDVLLVSAFTIDSLVRLLDEPPVAPTATPTADLTALAPSLTDAATPIATPGGLTATAEPPAAPTP